MLHCQHGVHYRAHCAICEAECKQNSETMRELATGRPLRLTDPNPAAARLERVVERFESRARHVIPGTMSLDDLWAWAERIETFIEGKKKPDKQTDGE